MNFRSTFFAAATILLAGLSAPAAHADTTSLLTASACSTGCSVLPAGTVTLSSAGPDSVNVTVNLADDYSFRLDPDSQHFALAFDLTDVSGVTASNFSSGDTTSQTFAFLGAGSYSTAGLGSFQYAVDCTSCAPGATSTPTRTLSFTLSGQGLGLDSFGANSNGYYFSVDPVGLTAAAGVGLTGNIGATSLVSPAPTPEPSTLALLGTGVFAAAGAIRRKRRA